METEMETDEKGKESKHKGWYSRGYLPHFDSPDVIQMITFRLADSLPAMILNQIEHENKFKPDAVKRMSIDKCLDTGHGACYLQEHKIAKIVEDAFLHFDGERYSLLAWVIMPNHVHVMIEIIDGFSLNSLVYSWKSFTAKKINKHLGKSGRFWQREYWDRYIRDESHLMKAIDYLHNNPVKAGLVDNSEDWLYSSAKYITESQVAAL
jgi:putative DNA methylase